MRTTTATPGLHLNESEALRQWLTRAYRRAVAENPLPARLKAAALAAQWQGTEGDVYGWLGVEAPQHGEPVAPHEEVLVRLAPAWSRPGTEAQREAFRQAAGAGLGAWSAVLAFGAAAGVAFAAREVEA